MKKIANYFLIEIKDSDNISGYDIRNSSKRIKNFKLNEGFYLCFIDEILLNCEEENLFCEVICNNVCIVVRYRDIINCIL